MDFGLLVLRVVVGLTLAAHGTQKLFGWFGGYGPTGTGQWLEMIGFVPGRRHAMAAGVVETGAGVALAVGALTPLAAAGVVAVMVVAAVSTHVKQGFFATSGGFEYNLVLAVAGLTAAFTGAGAYSVDALLGLELGNTAWGIAALTLGVLGAVIQLAGRRPAATLNAEPAATK